MLNILEVPDVRKQAAPISVETYHVLGEQGLVDPRTELLRGVIIEKMSKSPLHVYLVGKLIERIKAACPSGRFIRIEAPLTLADSEPEPDISVVSGQPEDYRKQHPRTALLAVEVAISTQEVDRAKAGIYAEAGVGEYWLVLPEKEVIEVFTAPQGPAYGQKCILRRSETLVSTVLPDLRVELAKLFA